MTFLDRSSRITGSGPFLERPGRIAEQAATRLVQLDRSTPVWHQLDVLGEEGGFPRFRGIDRGEDFSDLPHAPCVMSQLQSLLPRVEVENVRPYDPRRTL